MSRLMVFTNPYFSWLICGLMYGRALMASTCENVQVIRECCKNIPLQHIHFVFIFLILKLKCRQYPEIRQLQLIKLHHFKLEIFKSIY